MSKAGRIQVRMRPEEAERFDRLCRASTLIARLVRDHLDREEQIQTNGKGT